MLTQLRMKAHTSDVNEYFCLIEFVKINSRHATYSIWIQNISIFYVSSNRSHASAYTYWEYMPLKSLKMEMNNVFVCLLLLLLVFFIIGITVMDRWFLCKTRMINRLLVSRRGTYALSTHFSRLNLWSNVILHSIGWKIVVTLFLIDKSVFCIHINVKSFRSLSVIMVLEPPNQSVYSLQFDMYIPKCRTNICELQRQMRSLHYIHALSIEWKT